MRSKAADRLGASTAASVADEWAKQPLGARRQDWLWPLSLPFLAFLILPLVALLARTPAGRLLENLRQPEVHQAIALSLNTASLATLASILIGTPVAYLMARRTFRFKRALDTLIDLPMVLPPAVAGVALLMAFGRRGLLGGYLEELGLHIAFTRTAVVIAQTFIAAPLFIKSAVVGFATVERELEQAAALDGASRWGVFRHITVPLAWTALLSGAVLAWARALGEFGATIIFAGNFPGRTQTMPLAIYIGFELELGIALTLAVLLVGCSFLVLIAVKALLHRPAHQIE
ncbi:MAG: molybdate ABC transporter permease subunit [Anaerolineales bacterium]|nr:molybdate ABC transporter permease subunit [Anaerolineales bacterium]